MIQKYRASKNNIAKVRAIAENVLELAKFLESNRKPLELLKALDVRTCAQEATRLF